MNAHKTNGAMANTKNHLGLVMEVHIMPKMTAYSCLLQLSTLEGTSAAASEAAMRALLEEEEAVRERDKKKKEKKKAAQQRKKLVTGPNPENPPMQPTTPDPTPSAHPSSTSPLRPPLDPPPEPSPSAGPAAVGTPLGHCHSRQLPGPAAEASVLGLEPGPSTAATAPDRSNNGVSIAPHPEARGGGFQSGESGGAPGPREFEGARPGASGAGWQEVAAPVRSKDAVVLRSALREANGSVAGISGRREVAGVDRSMNGAGNAQLREAAAASAAPDRSKNGGGTAAAAVRETDGLHAGNPGFWIDPSLATLDRSKNGGVDGLFQEPDAFSRPGEHESAMVWDGREVPVENGVLLDGPEAMRGQEHLGESSAEAGPQQPGGEQQEQLSRALLLEQLTCPLSKVPNQTQLRNICKSIVLIQMCIHTDGAV